MANRVVLLTGGTGLIGNEIANVLARNGFTVNILTRSPQKSETENIFFYHWDVKQQTIDEACFKDVNFAIHLAGASIAKRWTESYKKTIIDSRIKTAEFLLQKMKEHKVKLDCYVGASASGYYVPNTGDTLFETSTSGYGFLAEVCEQWEAAHQQFSQVAKRVVIHRIGFVLAKQGGALAKMLPPFAVNLAPYFGDGEQFYPCIHLSDVANQFVFSLVKDNVKGIYNASNEIVSQKTLNNTIADVLGKNVMQFGIPNFILKLAFGKMRYLLTDSFKMSGAKVNNEGFNAQFPTVKEALQDLLVEPKPEE